MYHVKEIFYTLQGEGAKAGTPAVFCRFSGCNLWSGRQEDRAHAACRFCDTDFVGTDGSGGGKFAHAADLARACRAAAAPGGGERLVVLTGGEPMLQVDDALVAALKAEGFAIAIETNGTMPVVAGIDWVCVSPKAGTKIVQRSGDELKLVYPQEGMPPQAWQDMNFKHFFLQPMDGPAQAMNTQAAISFCLEHPAWRLSLQIHKVLGMR